MMQAAKECLEKNGFRVIQGLMGVTAQERLSLKCKIAIPTDIRIKLINMACKETGQSYEWIQADGRGTKFTSGAAFASHLRQREHYQPSKTTIFKVMGADTAIRFKDDISDPTIIVARSGYSDQLLNLEEKLRTSSKDQRKYDLFICDEVPEKSFSSTEVRMALDNDDWTTVNEMCPQAIMTSLAPIWRSVSGKQTQDPSPMEGSARIKPRHRPPTTGNAARLGFFDSINVELKNSWANQKEREEAMAIFPIQESSEEEPLSGSDDEEVPDPTPKPFPSKPIATATFHQEIAELEVERIDEMRANHRNRTEMRNDSGDNMEAYEESRSSNDEDDIVCKLPNHLPTEKDRLGNFSGPAMNDSSQQRGRKVSRDAVPTTHCIKDHLRLLKKRRHSAPGNGNTPIPVEPAVATTPNVHCHSLTSTERCQSDRGDLSSENRARLNTRRDATESLVISTKDRENIDYAAYLREKTINLLMDAHRDGTLCKVLNDTAIQPRRGEQSASCAKDRHEEETEKEVQHKDHIEKHANTIMRKQGRRNGLLKNGLIRTTLSTRGSSRIGKT